MCCQGITCTDLVVTSTASLPVIVIAAAPSEKEPLRREAVRIVPSDARYSVEAMTPEYRMHQERELALSYVLNFACAVRESNFDDHGGCIRGQVRKACFALRGVCRYLGVVVYGERQRFGLITQQEVECSCARVDVLGRSHSLTHGLYAVISHVARVGQDELLIRLARRCRTCNGRRACRLCLRVPKPHIRRL